MNNCDGGDGYFGEEQKQIDSSNCAVFKLRTGSISFPLVFFIFYLLRIEKNSCFSFSIVYHLLKWCTIYIVHTSIDANEMKFIQYFRLFHNRRSLVRLSYSWKIITKKNNFAYYQRDFDNSKSIMLDTYGTYKILSL